MRRRGGGAPCWSQGTKPASDYLPAKVRSVLLAPTRFRIDGRRFSFLSTQTVSSADGAAPHRVRITGAAHSPLLTSSIKKVLCPLLPSLCQLIILPIIVQQIQRLDLEIPHRIRSRARLREQEPLRER